jgi:hypothetical protein
LTTETKGRKCGTKIRHRSFQAALAHKKDMIANGAAGDWLNVYACEHCSGWHVGHRPGRRKA